MEGVTAVFNSSPLIFLDKLGYLNKSLRLFHMVIIPKKVVDEIYAKDDEVKQHIIGLRNQENTIFGLETNLVKLYEALTERLGKGEAEAISLAIEKNADLVILDDYAARRIAMELGLEVKGTLGIVKKLIEDKKVDIQDADKFYEKLVEIGFRVKRRIFDNIFYNLFKDKK